MQHATKIVATLGPASDNAQAIGDLILAGASLLRLNFSHGTQADQAARIEKIRAAEADIGKPVGILADLQGPKHRVGQLDRPLDLSAGELLGFHLPDQPAPQGAAKSVPLPHPEVIEALQPGALILMDDGRLRARVISLATGCFVAEMLEAGQLTSNKGVNLPDLSINTPALTDKDKADLAFALAKGVDWVALSFVQRTSDILQARSLLGGQAAILAKIEKPAALAEIDDIILAADGVMVARGDLGVEMPPQQVPVIQKQIISACRRVGKPVIIATQMMESMIQAPAPTRAEASDVAGAVFEGADAVMLSAETAIGSYPEKSVAMMAAIACAAEAHIIAHPEDGPARLEVEDSVYHAVAEAAVRLAETVRAKAVLAFTASGTTAIRIARERPKMPIFTLTPSEQTRRKLALVWGVESCLQEEDGYEKAVADAIQQAVARGLAQRGDNLVIVSGMPFGLAGTTNALRVITI